jgi:hypothetical protein
VRTCSLIEQDRPAAFFAAAAAAECDGIVAIVAFIVDEECATEISSTMRANPKSQIFILILIHFKSIHIQDGIEKTSKSKQ